MASFDALRHLSIYLYDAHTGGKHHLADVYELVQYCGNIVPRLYLMFTVGSVYMSVPDAPIKEIMKDMMEMGRGVQHPTRGLFLRHYLSGSTRDHLPTGTEPGPAGDLSDSVGFVLSNFVEMNKLWVRQQHLGPSREREKREMERRELQILVGTNLVRLSQLDGVTLDMYRTRILPAVLEQVIQCKDLIAQEYLMEVVIQVFPDDFHLRTLDLLLSACSRLHPKVSVKQIVIALINRLAAYAVREAENEPPAERRRQEEDAAQRLAAKSREMRRDDGQPPVTSVWASLAQEQPRKARDAWSRLADDLGAALPDDEGRRLWGNDGGVPRPTRDASGEHDTSGASEASVRADAAATEPSAAADADAAASDAPNAAAAPDVPDATSAADAGPAAGTAAAAGAAAEAAPDATAESGPRKFRGIPDDVRLFEVFWEEVVQLMRARPDLSMQDKTSLLLALLNLSLSCYPDRLEYVDQVLAFAHEQWLEAAPAAQTSGGVALQEQFTALLLAPVNAYVSVVTVLALPHFHVLWAEQSPQVQRTIAKAIVSSMLRRHTVVSTPADADGLLSLCATLVRDQSYAVLSTPAHAGPGAAGRGLDKAAVEHAEYQNVLARLVHQFRADDPEVHLALLYTVKQHYVHGGDAIRITYLPLVSDTIALVRRFATVLSPKEWTTKMTTLFYFVQQLISALYHRVESPKLCLRLFLMAADVAGHAGFEEMAYEFFVQSFSIFEESISDSRAQLQTIGLLIGSLYKSRVFSAENYDTLTTKAALYGAKLLKRPHQATAVLLASRLWWQLPGPGETPQDVVQDGRRVLECLQKTMRIANGCMQQLVSVEIFCEALGQYLYYVRGATDFSMSSAWTSLRCATSTRCST